MELLVFMHEEGMTISSFLVMITLGLDMYIENAHWIRPTMNYDGRLSIVMIHHDVILHGFSTLRGY